MAEEKKLTDKEMDKKMKELKIELLKQTTKRKGIKREIARLLTVKQNTEKKNK
jgi:ribosomal protein L29